MDQLRSVLILDVSGVNLQLESMFLPSAESTLHNPKLPLGLAQKLLMILVRVVTASVLSGPASFGAI